MYRALPNFFNLPTRFLDKNKKKNTDIGIHFSIDYTENESHW